MTSSRTRLLKRPKLTVIFSLEKILKVVTETDPITCFEWNFVFVFCILQIAELRLGGMSQGSGGVKVACTVTPDTHQSLIPYTDPLVLVGAFHRDHNLTVCNELDS